MFGGMFFSEAEKARIEQQRQEIKRFMLESEVHLLREHENEMMALADNASRYSAWRTASQSAMKNGSFKLGGQLNIKLKKKQTISVCQGVNPFTTEPCVFKEKPASQIVGVYPMKN